MEVYMTFNDVLDFVRENPVCFLATMDGDQPRVRGVVTVLFDDGKLYFTTGAKKAVYRQLMAHPKVELCCCTQDYQRMLRIAGAMEVVDDREKKQKLIEERDYLKGLTADDPRFVLLRMPHGSARFWTLADNMKEDQLEIIEF